MQRPRALNVTRGHVQGRASMDQHLTTRMSEDGDVAARLLPGCLPPGWCLLGRARHGNRAPGNAPSGCHLLAHAGRGIALLDIAPDATPNAEARLRRVLAAAGFPRAFPGSLPVCHERLELAQLPRLGSLLARAFDSVPPLSLPPGDAWLAAVEAAIAADAAWAPARSDTTPDGMAPTPAPLAPASRSPAEALPRRGRRAGMLAAGLCLIFGLGWAAGRFMPSSGEDSATAGALQAEPAPAAAAAPPDSPATALQAAPPGPIAQPLARAVAVPSPPEAGAAEPMEAASRAASTLEVAPPPPLPPEPIAAPPPRITRARPPAYDRACSEAQFRWQRGDTLTSAEMAYVRNGCAPARLR